ncbi:hypothetical protein Ancab_021987 [Ancistrocladus abbreviatus]
MGKEGKYTENCRERSESISKKKSVEHDNVVREQHYSDVSFLGVSSIARSEHGAEVDGIFHCVSCAKVNDLTSCSRKQLIIMKNI